MSTLTNVDVNSHPKMGKINFKHTVMMFAIIWCSWVVTHQASEYMLRQMYEGNFFESLNNLLTNKDKNSLEYYFQQLMPAVAAFHIILIIIGSLFITRVKRYPLLWLLLLVTGDIILLIFHNSYSVILLDIRVDWAIPEIFQYFKEIFIAVVMFLLYKKNFQPLYLMFAGIAIFLFIDDALKYHETVGHMLAPLLETTRLPAILSAESNSIGELFSTLPLLIIAPFGAKKFFSADRETQYVVLIFVALLSVLFFFGVVIDFLSEIKSLNIPLELEDFGEMISLSLLLSYTVYRYWIPNK